MYFMAKSYSTRPPEADHVNPSAIVAVCQVTTWMGKPSRYVTRQLGQLSLPSPEVGKSSTGLYRWG